MRRNADATAAGAARDTETGARRGGRPPAYWDVHFHFQLENELSFPIGLSLRKEKWSGVEWSAWPVPGLCLDFAGFRLDFVWISLDLFGFRWISLDLGIVWVSVTFGELLLHWAGSERRPGDGSSGAGHPGRGLRGARPSRRAVAPFRCPAPLLLPSRLRSSALHVRAALHARPTP